VQIDGQAEPARTVGADADPCGDRRVTGPDSLASRGEAEGVLEAGGVAGREELFGMLSFRLGAPIRIATEMVQLLLDTIEGSELEAITLPTTLVRCEHLTADGPHDVDRATCRRKGVPCPFVLAPKPPPPEQGSSAWSKIRSPRGFRRARRTCQMG
jgi:hypothetical protein